MSRFNSVERQEILDKSQKCLWSSEGSVGMNYLLKTRHLNISVIKKFKLGFIPENVDHKLAGRIIFPIEDASGNCVALSSRLITLPQNDLPVYWHEKYEKSFYLYGLSYCKEVLRKKGFVIICEGQIDVMQCHNHGIDNAVGLCGNKLSPIQIATIYRYCNEIILLLDKDINKAGQKALDRVLEEFGAKRQEKYPIFRNKISFIRFKEHTDPDSYLVKYGPVGLQQEIDKKLIEMREVYDT